MKRTSLQIKKTIKSPLMKKSVLLKKARLPISMTATSSSVFHRLGPVVGE